MTTLLINQVTGMVLAIFYDFIKEKLAKTDFQRALYFAAIMVTLGTVLFTLPVFLLINIPTGLLVSWFASSVVIFLLGSLAFVRLLK